VSEDLGEPTLVMIEALFTLIIDRPYIYDNIAGIKNLGVSTAFQICVPSCVRG
jgi:hypothetical protein